MRSMLWVRRQMVLQMALIRVCLGSLCLIYMERSGHNVTSSQIYIFLPLVMFRGILVICSVILKESRTGYNMYLRGNVYNYSYING